MWVSRKRAITDLHRRCRDTVAMYVPGAHAVARDDLVALLERSSDPLQGREGADSDRDNSDPTVQDVR